MRKKRLKLRSKPGKFEAEKTRLEDQIKIQTSRDTSLEVGNQRKIESLEQELKNTELRHATELNRLEQSLQSKIQQAAEYTKQVQSLKAEVGAASAGYITRLTGQLRTQQQQLETLVSQQATVAA